MPQPDVIVRKRPEDWKTRLTAALREIGIVDEGFTGCVRINLSDGHVRNGQREESLR
jgi:hypothetical protein